MNGQEIKLTECFLSVASNNTNISKQYKKHTYSSRNVWYGIDNAEYCIEYNSDPDYYHEITGWIIGNRDSYAVYYYADAPSSTMPYEISEWKLFSDDTSDDTTVTNLISFDNDTLKKAIFLVTTNNTTGDYTINDIFIDSNLTNDYFVKIYTNAGGITEGIMYLSVDTDGKWYYNDSIPLTQPDNNYLIGTSHGITDPTSADFTFTDNTDNNNNYDIKYNGAYTNTIKSWSR